MNKSTLTILSVLFFSLLIVQGCGKSSGTDIDTEAPAAPANIKGTSQDQRVDLRWSANTESDLLGYNLYRSTSSFSDISGMEPVNGNEIINILEYIDTGLDNGTTYYYRLTAIDESVNESGLSEELEITPFDNPPDRP